ncbi:MAG: MFS transporter [Caulobacterales bacterium]|nr:MFS transporter [Caulobacterales bacterium]
MANGGEWASSRRPDAAIGSSQTFKVVAASTLGTLFEWYDFFIYGTLAAVLAIKFFPADNPTAGLLASLAAFGAGFGVRPLGAVVFGYLGDLVGRKRTFVITITLMGLATVLVGALPTYDSVGLLAPVLLVLLRLVQGLALGGEYGGAAIYVAEHAPPGQRGWLTSWIQLSALGGMLLSLLVALGCRVALGEEAFLAWGWRLPFLLSIIMLATSLYIRVTLGESPVFAKMKAEGRRARNPLKESLLEPVNFRRVLVAFFGVAIGLTVIWYTALFAALIFLQSTAKLPTKDVYVIMVSALVLAAPSFVFFGWLSDHVGRKPLLVLGFALSIVFLMPMYKQMTVAANPALAEAMAAAPVTISGEDCRYDVFAVRQETACAVAIAHLTERGVSYRRAPWSAGDGELRLTVGDVVVQTADADTIEGALHAAGYPAAAAPERVDHLRVIGLIVLMAILSGMTYGPSAALMVEMFPARVRYTSLSIPYHVGAGYVGGFLPFIAQFLVVSTGDVYNGLWYAIAVLAVALTVSVLFLPETKDRPVHE